MCWVGPQLLIKWHIAVRAKTINNKEVNGRPPLKKASSLPPGGYSRHFLVGYVVPPGSPNSDPISDPKCYFSTPVSRPGL